MDALRTTTWALGTTKDAIKLAYLRRRENRYAEHDRAAGADPLLNRTGIPAATFRYESPEYYRLTPRERNIVKRYTPGTPEYEALTPAQKVTVDERNQTRYEYEQVKQSLIDRAPFPFLRKYIRKQNPRYHRPYDPYRREDGEPLDMPSMALKARRWVNEVVTNTDRQLGEELQDPNVRRLYIGVPTAANLNPTLANPNGGEALYGSILDTQANIATLEWQRQANRKKIEMMTEWCLKYLRRHIRYILKIGKKEKSVFLDAFNTWWGKIQSVMGSANEPHTGRGAMLSPLYG